MWTTFVVTLSLAGAVWAAIPAPPSPAMCHKNAPPGGPNMIVNGLFDVAGSDPVFEPAQKWHGIGEYKYTVDATEHYEGSHSARVRTNVTSADGCYQIVIPTLPSEDEWPGLMTVEFKAWSKAQDVAVNRTSMADYSIYMDITLGDGSVLPLQGLCGLEGGMYYESTQKRYVGTHDWQLCRSIIGLPNRNITEMRVFLVYRYQSQGIVWFDDVSITLTHEFDAVGMHALILTSLPQGNDTALEVAENALLAQGVPYDVLHLVANYTPIFDGLLPLEDDEGCGKYLFIVSTTGGLGYQDRNGVWKSALSALQLKQLAEYQLLHNVRHVELFAFPQASDGVRVLGDPKSGVNETISFAPAALDMDPALNPTAKVSAKGLWLYRTEIVNATIASPVLLYDDQTVGAVLSKLSDGRERLVFFFAHANWSELGMVLGPMWLKWASHNVYVGSRRMYLSPQSDDWFLETDMWDPVKEENSEGKIVYRVLPEDGDKFVEEMDELNALFPNGRMVVEIGVNGEGVDDYDKDIHHGLANWTNLVGVKHFEWVSHTYDHANMNTMNRSEATFEIEENRKVFKELGWLDNFDHFSNRALISPEISGLQSTVVLQALLDIGIEVMVGDNSKPEFHAPVPWHGWWNTTVHSNVPGRLGMFIVPREATNVYYDCSLPVEQVSEYNKRYRSHWKRNLTMDELINLDVDRVSKLMYQFRHDPHMFHVANMRAFPWIEQGSALPHHSLQGIWLHRVLERVANCTSLPIFSRTFDELELDLLQRMARDAAAPQGRWWRFRGVPQALQLWLTSSEDAIMGISGLELRTMPEGGVREVYGVDTTFWMEMTPAIPQVFTLVKSAAATTTADGDGLQGGEVKPNKDSWPVGHITLHTKTASGLVQTLGGEDTAVNITLNCDGKYSTLEVHDLMDGSYLAMYPREPGQYTVDITLYGSPIVGSPFTFQLFKYQPGGTTTPDAPKSNKISPAILGGSIGGGVALVGGVALIFVWKKKGWSCPAWCGEAADHRYEEIPDGEIGAPSTSAIWE